jgi:hypothetical protein
MYNNLKGEKEQKSPDGIQPKILKKMYRSTIIQSESKLIQGSMFSTFIF